MAEQVGLHLVPGAPCSTVACPYVSPDSLNTALLTTWPVSSQVRLVGFLTGDIKNDGFNI